MPALPEAAASAMSANFLLYDGDCPFCANYARMLRLRKAVGPIEMRNAREHPGLAARCLQRGYDLDQGMLLHLDGRDYWGADCIHRLALLSSDNDCFNRLNARLFRHRTLSRVLYPLLRAGRNLSLKLRDRPNIHG